MRSSFLKSLFLSVLLAFSGILPLFAAGGSDADEKSFDVVPFIMHHIADAHDWHIADIGGHSISLPLPIILYTNSGLKVFSSGKFEHDDAGKVLVEAGGERLVKFHEKIYYANETPDEKGNYVSFDDEHHATNAIPLDFSITRNVASMFLSILILLLMFTVMANSYKRNVVPKGLGAFLEPVVLFIRDDIALPNIGEQKYARFMPYLLTVFFFILINNLLGLVPFFPGGSNLTGNIGFTLVLAVFTLIITNVNGTKDYWMHMLWMPGVPIPVRLILAPIELIGVLTKPFALMMRLFANITAGHILILSLISLIFMFQSLAVAPVSLAFALFMNCLELLVAFLQAYIFTLLSALFIGAAVAEHEHH